MHSSLHVVGLGGGRGEAHSGVLMKSNSVVYQSEKGRGLVLNWQ